MRSIPFFFTGAILAPLVSGLGFTESDVSLADRDIATFEDVAFGDAVLAKLSPRNTGAGSSPRCKAFPTDNAWPSEQKWSKLNESVGGALLKPLPAAAVCYGNSPAFNAAACNFLLTNASSTTFYLDDPLTILSQWAQGNTCPAARNTTGSTCTQGGFPVYVVNATSVKQVQAAVNFARNNNVRLVIKNTGHDSVGRNAGGGSLSVWTHYLKGFEFLPQYTQPGGNYRGPAARVGSGLQVFEAFANAEKYNVTLTAASCLTIGSYGGWITGGGHSPLASKFGLGVDQVLSLQVVTADGRLVTADPRTNEDLFFALRGGGGSTYGIITSAIVKSHPQINLTIASFTFTLGSTASTTPGPAVTITNSTAFWKGFDAVFAYGIPTVDAGGYLWTNGINLGAGSFTMQTRAQMPGLTPAQATTFIQPLLTTLNALGIPVTIDTPSTVVYSSQRGPLGAAPGNSRFASRIFPRAAYQNATLFAATMAAARATVEAGYVFHGLNMAPTYKAGGFSAPAGVNPVWRTAVMHADVFDSFNIGTATPAEATAAHVRLDALMGPLRVATPGGGAYLNEADVQEPDWQHSFYGSNYEKLVRIKRARDPWGVFWAPATPGSESWAVQTPNEIPSQNGRLCRV
ncbi:hypothetical protein B0H63DRAFT_410663 [Podospora didyma]|uniref:FAD-binding PCMH-type domain-containing protein n=1 Tax=Podospora didyma TaxID=330526 RepID=A0AAE0U4P3_9PEZI|nr:hypothetical protein B0H63DRAFT_410663 [Podospora didyma]